MKRTIKLLEKQEALNEDSIENTNKISLKDFKQDKLRRYTELVAKVTYAEEYDINTGELNKICQNTEILPAYYQYGPNRRQRYDEEPKYGVPEYIDKNIIYKLGFHYGKGSNYYKTLIDKKYNIKFTVNISIRTTSKDFYGTVYGTVSISNISKEANNEENH